MSDRPRHIVIRLASGCPPTWSSIDGLRFNRPADLDMFTRQILPGIRVVARPSGEIAQGGLEPAEIWDVSRPGWAHDQQRGYWALVTVDDVEVGGVSDRLILDCADRDSLAREVARKYGSLPAVLV